MRLDNRKPLAILMLTWEYPPNMIGGIARHTHGLAESLSESCEIHVITAMKEGLDHYECINGVAIHRVDPLNNSDAAFVSWIGGLNLAMYRKVMELSEGITFDLIHAHDWLVGAAGEALKKVLAIPLISTIHATEKGRHNGIHTELQRFIHNKEKQLIEVSNKIIVCSDYMKNEIEETFKLEGSKITVIPNGIGSELSLSSHGPIQSQQLPQNVKIIFSLGRMVHEKGFQTLIEAASMVKQRGLEYYFVIAGNGPMLDAYRKEVSDQCLEKQIAFIGYIGDQERDAYFTLCDAAVFPSLYEPFGIVALESMKNGVLTIVANTGGLSGIIQPHQTGLHMTPGSAESLLNQLEFIFDNEQESYQIAKNGKKAVERSFCWEKVALDTLHVMKEVVSLVNKS